MRVAQHLLHEADVGAALKHEGGHRVAEEMTRAGFLQAGRFDVLPHQRVSRSGEKPMPVYVRNIVPSSSREEISVGRTSARYFSVQTIIVCGTTPRRAATTE